MGNIIAFNPCSFCGKKDMCSMCELQMRRENVIENTEWISVDERLPEETQSFLVALNNEDIDIRVFNHKTEPLVTYPMMFNKFIVLDTHNEWWIENKVTHWMPLPDPPKGGAE